MTNKNYAVVTLNQINESSSVNVFTNVSEDDAIKFMKEIAEKVASYLK